MGKKLGVVPNTWYLNESPLYIPFEANNIDRNELQIRLNSQKGTETKMAEKLNNLEKFQPYSLTGDLLITGQT